MKTGFLILALACAVRPVFAGEATITSDELVLRDNGEKTIFSGHVVLTQDAYEIRADRMERAKVNEIVTARGHVVGTWVSAKNEHMKVEGDSAQYVPKENTIDVWSTTQVIVTMLGEKGNAVFHGDRGWAFTLQPGIAKLIGRVTGHVVPAP